MLCLHVHVYALVIDLYIILPLPPPPPPLPLEAESGPTPPLCDGQHAACGQSETGGHCSLCLPGAVRCRERASQGDTGRPLLPAVSGESACECECVCECVCVCGGGGSYNVVPVYIDLDVPVQCTCTCSYIQWFELQWEPVNLYLYKL